MKPRLPRHEKVNGHPIACYNDGGKSADRYTVVYLDCPERLPDHYQCLGMNDEPFHPQGIGMHSTAMVGRHLGKRIPFATLPNDCRKAVLQDLAS